MPSGLRREDPPPSRAERIAAWAIVIAAGISALVALAVFAVLSVGVRIGIAVVVSFAALSWAIAVLERDGR